MGLSCGFKAAGLALATQRSGKEVKVKGLLLIVAGAFVLAGGVFVVSGAGAQEGEGERPGVRFVAETAERLGVTPEELTTAMTEARVEIIDEAVAEGSLTEEQAAKLKERIEEYGPLLVMGRGHRADKALCHGARLVVGAAADVLGKEPAEVAEALRSGESLAEQAEAQGMNVEDFKAALLEAIEAKLQTKVDEGTITQEQADRIFEGIEEHIDRIINFEGQGGDRPCQRPGGDLPMRPEAEATPAA
jgi:lipoate-protein ligase A